MPAQLLAHLSSATKKVSEVPHIEPKPHHPYEDVYSFEHGPNISFDSAVKQCDEALADNRYGFAKQIGLRLTRPLKDNGVEAQPEVTDIIRAARILRRLDLLDSSERLIAEVEKHISARSELMAEHLLEVVRTGCRMAERSSDPFSLMRYNERSIIAAKTLWDTSFTRELPEQIVTSSHAQRCADLAAHALLLAHVYRSPGVAQLNLPENYEYGTLENALHFARESARILDKIPEKIRTKKQSSLLCYAYDTVARLMLTRAELSNDLERREYLKNAVQAHDSSMVAFELGSKPVEQVARLTHTHGLIHAKSSFKYGHESLQQAITFFAKWRGQAHPLTIKATLDLVEAMIERWEEFVSTRVIDTLSDEFHELPKPQQLLAGVERLFKSDRKSYPYDNNSRHPLVLRASLLSGRLDILSGTLGYSSGHEFASPSHRICEGVNKVERAVDDISWLLGDSSPMLIKGLKVLSAAYSHSNQPIIARELASRAADASERLFYVL